MKQKDIFISPKGDVRLYKDDKYYYYSQHDPDATRMYGTSLNYNIKVRKEIIEALVKDVLRDD